MKTYLRMLSLLVLLLAAYQSGMARPVHAETLRAEKHALTYTQMVEEAMAQVRGISPAQAYYRVKNDSNTLLVDVSDAADVLETGLATGGVNITLGMLPVRADLEVPKESRYFGLQDRSRPIITTCQSGPNGARAAKLLNDMGFTHVVYVTGGMKAWTAAGYPTNLHPAPSFEPGEETFRPGEY